MGFLIWVGIVVLFFLLVWCLHDWLLTREPRQPALRRVWHNLDAINRHRAVSPLGCMVTVNIEYGKFEINVTKGEIRINGKWLVPDPITGITQRDLDRVLKKARRISDEELEVRRKEHRLGMIEDLKRVGGG
jgi:hypothetical protein